jgi:hypothetical protein
MLLRVVVAIEPRSYRQVIGRALRALRPHLVEVVVLDPDTLEAGVARMEPHLVFADRPTPSRPKAGPSAARCGWSSAPTRCRRRRGCVWPGGAGSLRRSTFPTCSR